MDKDIIEFKRLAEMRWKYLKSGDSAKGNECFDKLAKLTSELKSKNELEKLSVLLEDVADGVKLEAASKLLSLNDSNAQQVLGKR